jgi:hypothetical protein
MGWLRALRSFIGRLRTPERELYLREHERERELGMRQIREMTGAVPGRAGDASGDHESKT